MKIIARKTVHRILPRVETPPEKLRPIQGIRKLKDRQKFQYKLILENGKELHFKNFDELRYYSNAHLRWKSNYVVLTRENNE